MLIKIVLRSLAMAHGHGAWLKRHLIMRHTNPQSYCSEFKKSLEAVQKVNSIKPPFEKRLHSLITFKAYESSKSLQEKTEKALKESRQSQG